MIGVEDTTDEELMAIAVEGRKNMLLYPWVNTTNSQNGEEFFFNILTQETSVADPQIEQYKAKVETIRGERETALRRAIAEWKAPPKEEEAEDEP